MNRLIRSRCGVLALVLLALVLVPGFGAGAANDGISLRDLGWRLTGPDSARTLDLSVLITNGSPRALSYEVRFVVERAEPATPPATGGQTGKGSNAEPAWRQVQVIPVSGGPLAAGASVAVHATVPFNALAAGKQHRFRAELVDRSTGLLLAQTVITSGASSATAAAAALGLGVAGSYALKDVGGPYTQGRTATSGEAPHASTVSGSGHMVGKHEAHRVGGEWVESGSGTMNVRTSDGILTLKYTYTSRGPSVASLSATATATGQLITPRLGPVPVTITQASAQMTFPGARRSAGRVISRIGSTATGTFSGTVGGQAWSGVLTMTNGDQTYNLATGGGNHRFDIQFTASQQ